MQSKLSELLSVFHFFVLDDGDSVKTILSLALKSVQVVRSVAQRQTELEAGISLLETAYEIVKFAESNLSDSWSLTPDTIHTCKQMVNRL